MNKFINLVSELNANLYDNSPKLSEELGICYSFKTDGYVEIIDFLGIDIYNSEFQEYDDNDEPIEPTVASIRTEVRNLINEVLKSLGNIEDNKCIGNTPVCANDKNICCFECDLHKTECDNVCGSINCSKYDIEF